jgi:hypothetical protein
VVVAERRNAPIQLDRRVDYLLAPGLLGPGSRSFERN